MKWTFSGLRLQRLPVLLLQERKAGLGEAGKPETRREKWAVWKEGNSFLGGDFLIFCLYPEISFRRLIGVGSFPLLCSRFVII